MQFQAHRRSRLILIRLLHTAVWLFFCVCVFALPVAGGYHRFGWAMVLTGLILLECLVLFLNHKRCPLTDLAARYTPDRADNFDIYLPLWLARHNKAIFGTLFVIFDAFVLVCWLQSRR